MSTDARYEKDVLAAYEAGKLKSVATKTELGKLRAAARVSLVEVAAHHGWSVPSSSEGT